MSFCWNIRLIIIWIFGRGLCLLYQLWNFHVSASFFSFLLWISTRLSYTRNLLYYACTLHSHMGSGDVSVILFLNIYWTAH